MNISFPNKFNYGIAGRLCEASADAYCESQIDNAQTDIHVLIRRDESDAVVAFRGTADPRNWLTDLDCRFWRDALCGRIHHGFHVALASVWDELEAELANIKCKRLWLTGHSLGGALAMLCAWYWEGPIAGVYTFGQPRIGNAKFRDNYNLIRGRRTFRVIHANDIVPRIPWMLGSYRHAGHEIFFPTSAFTFQPSAFLSDSSWIQKLPRDAANAWRELQRDKVALLADHHVDTYLELLRPAPITAPCSGKHDSL